MRSLILGLFFALSCIGTALPGAFVGLVLDGEGDPELPANGYQTWMLPGGGAPPMWPIVAGSKVDYLIDGSQTFRAMSDALKTATGNQHFIYLIGWWLTDDFHIRGRGRTTMRDILSDASAAGVEVRAMLSGHQRNVNAGPVQRIHALANGAAVLDNRHLNWGSHHQKILVVYGTQGLIAFVGGIDINPDRIFAQGVGPNQNGDTQGAPFHDVHAEVRGPVAWDLLHIFVQRWTDHPTVAAMPAAKKALRGNTATFPVPGAIGGATLQTQVGRTYGNSTTHTEVNPPYAFAATGAQQPARMIMKAIAAAQDFIYLEDQYFVDTTSVTAPIGVQNVRAALAAALARGVKVIVVIPADAITIMGYPAFGIASQTAYRRALLINALRAGAGGANLRVFYPKNAGQFKTYVHSKCWIFDDKYAIIGSANTNRRSWTHDSEAVIGVWDRGKADKSTLYFAHRLRIALWSKYLNTNDMKTLKNPATALALWNAGNLPKGAYVAESSYPATPAPGIGWDALWDSFIDPEGS